MVATYSHTATPLKPQQETTSHEEKNPTMTCHVLKDNVSIVARKSRGKQQVCSRYLAPSPSSTATTMVANTTPPSTVLPSLPKRSQSVVGGKPGGRVSKRNNVKAVESSAATKMFIASTRSLSVSFQSEAFSLPVNKTKGQVSDHWENSKSVDHHRWLERTRKANSGSNLLSRSLDCKGERKMFEYGEMVVKSLQRSMMLNESSRKVSLSFDFERAAKRNKDANYVNEPSRVSCDLRKISKGRIEPRNIAAPATFRPETDSRLRRLSDTGTTKSNQSKKFSRDVTISSPIRGSTRPARVGNSVNSPSNVSLSVDVRRGKTGEDRIVAVRRGKTGEGRIVDAHVLRLLYNHYLQWRFANAKADASFMVQKLSAERNLRSASVKTSELRNSVTFNRIKLLLLRQKLKLFSILKGQIAYLEAWAVIDNDKSGSLLGASEALKASTLLLPIVGKALVDIRSLKDAVGSAVDVMQAMASSMSSLSSKVEEVKSLMDEVMNVTASEKVLLEQCTDILSMLAMTQVKDCSLRTHLIQLNFVPIYSTRT